MFKKSLLTLVIALTLVVGVSKAHAYSLEDAMADIASLKTQITELKDQLSAAVITTKASSTVTAVPVTTEPVVSTEKTVTFSSSANILPNQKGGDVIVLQQALKDKGYYNGEVTGTFGAVTEKAVRTFQTANKIASTGVVGPTTKSLLTTPTGNTCAPTVTFIPPGGYSFSTPSQYINTGNGTGQSVLEYKITIPTSCHSVKITELKLSNTGTPNVIASAKIGSVTVPVVNNVATFNGLNLTVPNTTAGLQVIVTLKYPAVSPTGVPSGTVSNKVKLTYIKYTNIATGVSSTVNTNTALSPNMMLVGGIANIMIGNSTYPVLKNNTPSNIATIVLGGGPNIKIISIPLEIKITQGPASVLNTSANSVIIKDPNGNIVPTTHPAFTQINSTTFRTTVTFNQPLFFNSPYSTSFDVYALFSGLVPRSVPPNPLTSWAQISVESRDKFSWIDFGAGNTIPFTTANSMYYLDYPTDNGFFALAGAPNNP